MKKYLLITALILTATTQSVMSAELFNSPEELENFHDNFYESPMMPIPEVKYTEQEPREIKGMPLFKKTRIKMTNYFREKNYKETQKLLEKEKAEQARLEAEENEKLNKELNINFQSNNESKSKIKTEIEEATSIPDETLELSGGVQERVTPNDALLDADNIDYDDETMDIIATGSPVLVFPPQETTIKADKIVYNQASNTLKAYGNVKVIKSGNTVNGDFMQINMNEENAFIDNLNAKQAFMTVKSRKSKIEGDKIILYDGKIVSEDSYILNLQTKMIGGNHFNRMIIDEDDRSSISTSFGEVGDTAIHIKAKDIIVNAKKEHDTFTMKQADVYYGDYKLFRIPSFTAHTNKGHDYFEANYPEFGSRSRIGMFAGPGFVFDVPNGAIVKAIPFLNYKDKIGVGGALKYRSATNYTDFMYGSSNDTFVLKGKQYLDDKLYMQYGANSYMDEWFFGRRMPKYSVELIYDDRTKIPSTIKEGYDLNFRHRASIGYMQNNDINRYGERLPASDMGTTRFKYMAEARQSLFNYGNREELKFINLSLVTQGSAALYGNGDMQFLGRIGPAVHTQYKYWMQDIGFFASAYQDGTPMARYDAYRYGHANVYIREAIRVHKYLTLAWSGSLTMTGDSPNGDMFQENSFILAFGPDDFKVNVGYDCVRKQTYFSFVVAMDTKGSSVEYEKMEIKNPDRLGKKDKEQEKLIVYDQENPTNAKGPAKKMMYAEVIDIEDPNREQI
ncbi:organic solvent tolerance protein [Clostridium sp. CAG:967]|nr:organic solvent tolerance protein [Clostridium sp. CAG:967]